MAAPKPELPAPRRLLGIWPHPDDEAYLSAGLMGRTTDAGGHVTVLTLTRGTKGTSDPAEYDQPAFGARREAELRASGAEVGVHDVRVGDYRDGECDLVADEVAIELIAATIADVTPDAIVTFGPDGITGHTDHCVVSAWVTEAWRRTRGAELLYATMTDTHIAHWAELHERIRLFADRGAVGPAPVPAEQVALTVAMQGAELDRKRRALARHASQTGPLAAFMGETTYRAWLRSEFFRRPTADEIRSCALTFASHDAPVTT
jgi:LmbE family N-acetylglucosaminyl deacetylase